MNYGLYMAASGMLTHMHQQDVVANNLANVNTTGFKRALVGFQQRAAQADSEMSLDGSHALLDQLGGNVWVNQSSLDQSDGSLQQTGRSLDIAIQGDGFFPIQSRTGEMLLTRDGHFTINAQHELVTLNGGQAVVDASGRPVTVDPAQTLIVNKNGELWQGEDQVGRIQLYHPSDPAQLKALGQGRYQAPRESWLASDGRLLQGHVEQSNVDPIKATLNMMSATSAIGRQGNIIQYHDKMMDRAVNQLGRIT